MWIYFFSHMKTHSGESQIVGSVLVIIMTTFSVDRELKPIKWNRATAYPMVLFGIGILLIGLIHKVGDGYMMYAIDLAIVFPAFYYVWANRDDHEVLFRHTSKAILLFGIISYCYCFFLSTRGELEFRGVRVQGYLSNPNYLGMLGIIVFISGGYLLIDNINSVKRALISSLGIGIGISYAFLAVSRTAMLSEITCLIVLTIFALKQYKMHALDSSKVWRVLLGASLIIVFTSFIGIKMDNINYSVIARNNTTQTTEEAAQTTEQNAQPDVDEIEKLAERTNTDRDVEALSSGRTGLWKIYLSNLSWLGKPKKEIVPLLSGYTDTRPHNNIIDYLYRCGYIVGGIYVIYYLTQGISGLILLFSRKYTRTALCFSVMIIGTYSIYAMLEVCTLAFIRCVPCIYFISIAPIIAKSSEDLR